MKYLENQFSLDPGTHSAVLFISCHLVYPADGEETQRHRTLDQCFHSDLSMKQPMEKLHGMAGDVQSQQDLINWWYFKYNSVIMFNIVLAIF